MSKWTAILLVLSASIVCGCSSRLGGARDTLNSVPNLARHYAVSEQTVRDLAHAYGVDPSDLAAYGEAPFPVNYVQHAFNWKWNQAEHPTIYRARIEAFMTGYVSRCEVSDTETLYLFYANRLRPATRSEAEALPMGIVYQLDVTQQGTYDDQVVAQITYYDLRDSGGLLWEHVAPICDPPAKY